MYKKTVIFRKFAICSSLNDAHIANFLKNTVLLYADDTIVLADSVKGLQKALNPIHQYFKGWKIHLAFEKNSTPLCMIYGELGRLPIECEIRKELNNSV